MNSDERIARLERSQRQWKGLNLVLVCALLFLTAWGASRPSTAPATAPANTLDLRGLRILDEQGRVVASLAPEGDSVQFKMFGSDGKQRFVAYSTNKVSGVTLGDSGAPGISRFYQSDEGGGMILRESKALGSLIRMDTGKSTEIVTFNPDGKIQWRTPE